MKFGCTLLSVRDMDRSLAFYKALFDQEVVCDLGWNKTLTCGLVLQSHFAELAGFSEERMTYRPHTMELYFETEDMDAFLARLAAHPETEKLHEEQTCPWLQRVIRIFDPDGHLIEVGECMESVACRKFDEGKTVQETSALIQHPAELVQTWYERYLERKK